MAIEKSKKQLEVQINEYQIKVDEQERINSDLSGVKQKLLHENSDLLHKLEEVELSNQELLKDRTLLTRNVDDLKHRLEDESRVKILSKNCK